jgi:hypothetical protein
MEIVAAMKNRVNTKNLCHKIFEPTEKLGFKSLVFKDGQSGAEQSYI